MSSFHTVYGTVKSLLLRLLLSFFLFSSGVHDSIAATKATAVPIMMTIKAQPILQSPSLYKPEFGPQSDVTCGLFHPTGKTRMPEMYSTTKSEGRK